MKATKKTDGFTVKEWEELAAHLSGEKNAKSELLSRFGEEDSSNSGKQWEELKATVPVNEKDVDVDKAWNSLLSRIGGEKRVPLQTPARVRILSNTFARIAAAALILIGIGSAVFYLANSGALSKRITLASGNDQTGLVADLPDGSRVFLNRNSEFSYRSNFGKKGRNVKLTGEAFFEISPDKAKPFIIDAGKARIKVVGTSFNVITANSESAVEVFVKTGIVELSDNTGSKSITLDPGFIGTINSDMPEKRANNNVNYLAWKDRRLDYNGQKLDVVFRDLKRVYNMEIVADDNEILENSWTSPIDNQSPDTIIQVICVSFNLSFSKDGNVYHLLKK
jgi:ferric-dicitrate binding protein FerR (iron transport regulator)